MRGYVPPLPFGAVLTLLGAGTVIGVGASVVLHRLYLIPVVLGVALALGIFYIFLTIWRAPVEPDRSESLDQSPFDDPVKDAQRMDSSPSEGRAPAEPDPTPVDPVDADPNYDPVEEADRLDSAPPVGSRSDDPK
jgi:hypothetical protein